MKKVAILVGAALIITAAIMYAGPRLLSDPERSNPAELDASTDDAALPPGFFCSDPALLTAGENELIEQVVDDATDAGVVDAPYFLEFADGRYVFGHSDSRGRTRPVYIRTSKSPKVYWYDDALARWNARRNAAIAEPPADRPRIGRHDATP